MYKINGIDYFRKPFQTIWNRTAWTEEEALFEYAYALAKKQFHSVIDSQPSQFRHNEPWEKRKYLSRLTTGEEVEIFICTYWRENGGSVFYNHVSYFKVIK